MFGILNLKEKKLDSHKEVSISKTLIFALKSFTSFAVVSKSILRKFPRAGGWPSSYELFIAELTVYIIHRGELNIT